MSSASERPRPLPEIAAAKPTQQNSNSSTDPVQLVLSRIPGAQKRGKSWVARCPAHDDKVPSLSIARGTGNRALIKCFGKCSTESVIAALGLCMKDLMPCDSVRVGSGSPPSPATATRRSFPTAREAVAFLEKANGPCTAMWTYHDQNNQPVGVTVRWNRADGSKDIRPIAKKASGWVIGAMPAPRPLFGFPELLAADPADVVFVCEGESCAEQARSLGLIATTSAGGALAAKKSDWSPLAGRDVIVLPDNDDSGRRYARDVLQLLGALSPPAQSRLVELPDLTTGGDIVDFVRARREAGADDDAIRSEIATLASSAQLLPTAESMDGTRSPEHDQWPAPQPLPDGLPAVAPFDFDLLPASLCPWIRDIAERVQCPPDFPAIAMMIVLATVIGRKVGIRPKRADDWLVVANLFGAAVGPPSVMKTPAILEPLRSLKRLEIEAKENFDRAMKEFEASELVAEERRRKAKKDIRLALSAEEGGEDPLELARSSLDREQPTPTRRRYLLNDTTVEKLGEILNENPNGVLCFRDELIGLLKGLEKEGQEGARAFYLEAWNGSGRYTYDRIGRGTVDIEAAIVSILGSIQPGPLQSYLNAAVQGCAGADGLMQRFQLAVYPDISREWKNVDRWPDSEARHRAIELVRRLDAATPEELGGQVDATDPDGIRFIRFEAAAQDLFDEWRARLEFSLRAETEHPVITAHLSKYRSLIPSLALLIHFAEGHRGAVSRTALERALRWGAYLESHARRIYAIAISPDLAEARALAAHILQGDLQEEFALRDVYRRGWIALGTRESASRAVEVLCDLDWLIATSEPTAGRTRTRLLVNPRIHQLPEVGTDRTAKRQANPPSVGFVSPVLAESLVSEWRRVDAADGEDDWGTVENGGAV